MPPDVWLEKTVWLESSAWMAYQRWRDDSRLRGQVPTGDHSWTILLLDVVSHRDDLPRHLARFCAGSVASHPTFAGLKPRWQQYAHSLSNGNNGTAPDFLWEDYRYGDRTLTGAEAEQSQAVNAIRSSVSLLIGEFWAGGASGYWLGGLRGLERMWTGSAFFSDADGRSVGEKMVDSYVSFLRGYGHDFPR